MELKNKKVLVTGVDGLIGSHLSFLRARATVIQGIEIGEDTVIGAGTVVIKNVMDGVLVKGTLTK